MVLEPLSDTIRMLPAGTRPAGGPSCPLARNNEQQDEEEIMTRTIRFSGLLLPVLLLAVAGAAIADEHPFVGSKSCKKCHIKQFKSWEETKMASAYASLQPGEDVEAKAEMGLSADEDYTQNAECVACHVTGHGKEGGFVSMEETPELAGVGCESCHGAGGTYLQDGYMTLKNKEYKLEELVEVGLVEKIGAEQCVQCHNENVPIEGYTFDFEAKKAEGTHENFPLKYDHD
jgi:hypothetical protein